MSAQLLRKYKDIILEAHISQGGHVSKREADYTDNSPYDEDCDECVNFVHPGKCKIVEGIISPEGWCKYFKEELDEKWGKETVVSPQEKGKYHGKTKAELLKSYNALKKSGPHKHGSPEYERMKELGFAIRAKGGWSKVK